jgi:EpsD family peptidyl-prolyl cis-trans isomerase
MSWSATTIRRRLKSITIVALSCLCLTVPASAEAGDTNGSQAAVGDNSVAAIVDGAEISDAELERRIKKSFGDNPNSENSTIIRAATLRSLIQEKMVDSLVPAKEITPSILEEIDVARRQILLKYFLDKNTGRSLKAPTEQDVKKFIEENPGYFNKRKTYHFAEIIIKSGSPTIERAINDRVQQLLSLKEPTPKDLQLLRDWLRQNNVLFGDASVWQSTEQIPIDTLKAIDLVAREKLRRAGFCVAFRLWSVFAFARF